MTLPSISIIFPHEVTRMEKYIYYGADGYAYAHIEKFRAQYEPVCFCDRFFAMPCNFVDERAILPAKG